MLASLLHAEAGTYADTDWPQILALYDELVAVYPSPAAELAPTVAEAGFFRGRVDSRPG